ncbi:MAG: SDR family oxidoreductase, partial [Thermoproteota archaeon]|nr:SDR family oxidoreductase [Thermoproteota archaeon]
NNAGISVYKNIADTTEEDWANTINVNLTGTFHLLQSSSSPHDEKRLGNNNKRRFWCRKTGFPKFFAYCSSKFGIMGLTESIAAEINDYNIRIMTICPGEIDTGMIKDVVDSGYQLQCKEDEMYKPEDVAKKIWDMITNSNKYKNSQSVEFYSSRK